MRPFVRENQALAIESAKLMAANQGKNPTEPSAEVEATIDRATQRITTASNAITLKDYSTAG